MPDSSEYNTQNHIWLTCADKLSHTLTPEQVLTLQKMTDAQESCNEILNADMYQTGFRDGAKFMMELLQSKG